MFYLSSIVSDLHFESMGYRTLKLLDEKCFDKETTNSIKTSLPFLSGEIIISSLNLNSVRDITLKSLM